MAGPPSNLGVKLGWGGCNLNTEHNLTTISSSPNIVTFPRTPALLFASPRPVITNTFQASASIGQIQRCIHSAQAGANSQFLYSICASR
ncbi:hypothetical protein FNYG_03711 [Fusarium nygamai]|uniref:Uncharacterized protein n=1 Tax=Gibberella nygamai TaxID=42673 RepID=A0A2K0WM87_GIBNY|nr:hypothetical protein FNYG_03711 [Fusarium nygamai]